MINFAFGRIHIFRDLFIGFECASPKTERPAGEVMDGKDHAVAEPVVRPSPFFLNHQSGLLQITVGMAAADGSVAGLIQDFGRSAEFKLPDEILAVAPLTEIASTDCLAFRMVPETSLKEG